MLQIPPGGSQEGKRDRGEQGWAGFGGVSPCHHAILGEGLKVQGESRPRDTAGKYLVRIGEGIKKEKNNEKTTHVLYSKTGFHKKGEQSSFEPQIMLHHG